jgi:hypothetical protein
LIQAEGFAAAVFSLRYFHYATATPIISPADAASFSAISWPLITPLPSSTLHITAPPASPSFIFTPLAYSYAHFRHFLHYFEPIIFAASF